MGAAAATATAGGTGGVYQDQFVAYWETNCDYYYSGGASTYDNTYEQTGGTGIVACTAQILGCF